jgi:WhiB family transcriptional regulator, redox-sensing transcriptional regulator
VADFARPQFYGDELGEVGLLLELLNRPAWHSEAACRQHPEVDFFPARASAAGPAKAVCAVCPLRAECREWALAQPRNLDGVWGGLSRQDRAFPRRRISAA